MFSLGGYQNMQYEEHSIIVDAKITDIKTVDDTDGGPVSYKHTYYGSYTINGKEYTNKKLTTKYTGSFMSDLHRGDTIEIRVDPSNPNHKVADGGLFIVGGFVLIVYSGIILYKRKKSAA